MTRLWAIVVVLAALNFPLAAQTVSVIVNDDAPAIEKFAASELSKQFRELFEKATVSVAATPDSQASHVVLIGSPSTNSLVRKAISDWPSVSDQGLVIRSVTGSAKPMLVVGGGSPRATLWAVYELGHRFGIRYLFRGDVLPATKAQLDLSGHDIVQEPYLRSRTWRTVNDFAIGPESWGVADHEKFLHQLAKMKFNRLMLSIYPWQPFVRYDFGGVSKKTALLWFGEKYPVNGDTVGKKVFRGAAHFENPDFAGLSTADEMFDAGTKHLTGLIDTAHKLGMSVGVSISPLEFPREFQSVLPGSKIGRGINRLTVVPGAEQKPTDPVLSKLVATRIRAYLKTYPNLDTLYLTLPEFPEWGHHAEDAAETLNRDQRLGSLTLKRLIDTASERNLIVSRERGEQAIRGNLVGLAFLQGLLHDEDLLTRPDGHKIELVITSVDPALYPVLDRVIPRGAATLNFIDYTARRVAQHRDLLSQIPAAKVPSRLIMTLADDNVGILPQSAMLSLEALMSDVKKLNWDGFSTRYWVPAELDPAVYYLSRASWERDLTAQDSLLELWTTTTGNRSAAERLVIAWKHLEKATNLIDKNDLGFTFPVRGLLMKHYTATPLPGWWDEATESYTQYMVELYRSHGAISGGAKPLLFYYAKRGEYVLEYFGAVKAVRQAALSKQDGDMDMTVEHLETALESIYNCINTLSDVAQDQSDKGLIAVLNAYAYRPLLEELEKLSADE